MASRPGHRFESFLPANFIFALLASAGFTYAIAFFWGMRAPRAFQPLALAGLLTLWRLLSLARRRAIAVISVDVVLIPLAILLFVMAWAAHEDPTLLYARRDWALGRWGQVGLIAMTLAYIPSALGAREARWVVELRFALVLALVAVVGVVVIDASSSPRVDVWAMQQGAADLLLAGKNFYRNFAVRDSHNLSVTIPFVYPPTVVYLGAIAKYFWDDVRYSNLLAIVITGIGLRSLSRRSSLVLPAIVHDAAALVFFLQPKLFSVLEHAWIDAIQLGYLVAGLALFLGRWRVPGAIVIGVALSSKQTMFWFLPLIAIFLGFRPREWIALAVTMAALLLPFVIWDFRALKACTWEYHAGLSPRPDALSFMAWYHDKFRIWRSTAWLAWLASFGVLALSAARLRGSLAGFGLATTAIYFLFFFFQKWAFANYYFLVAGFAVLAATLALKESGEADPGRGTAA